MKRFVIRTTRTWSRRPHAPTPSHTRPGLFAPAVAALMIGAAAHEQAIGSGPDSNAFHIIWTDENADASAHLTASTPAPIFDQITPDLLSLTLRGWQPASPADPYSGAEAFADQAHVFRLDLVVDGLVNPPGPLALGGNPWSPDMFGPRPVFGFIEFDVDSQKDSGGEVEPIALNRYLANVARFGGLPEGSIGQRAALSANDYDGDFFTGPQFERTGAEFVLVLCGCFTPTIVQEIGDGDGILGPGESMIVQGRFFERMQSVAPFAGAFGGSDFGLYDPEVNLLFNHDLLTDTTTISLVYALDQIGAAILTGEPQQPMDLNVMNHVSVAEALNDLIFTADGLFGPITDPAVATLIAPWQGRNPLDFLDVTGWSATALLATSYVSPADALYVWTDAAFDAEFGDMNADGSIDSGDEDAIASAISSMDGGANDGDGAVNGSVQIINFGPNFSLFDLTNNGVIDDADIDAVPISIPGDLNDDGLVNGVDLAALLALWGSDDDSADFNEDGIVNGADLAALLTNWTG